MRCLYREKKYFCGNYLEVDIFPVFKKANSRRKKAKPTSETQAKLNQHNAEQKLTRLLNTNFTEDDIRFDVTYSNENLPLSDEQAQKDLQNFLRRVKRYREKHGLEPLKYIAVIEKGTRSGRYHHHIVLNGGISNKELAKMWGKGYTTIKPLQFDECGLVGIARYLVKNPVCGKRWCASRNLKQPKTSTRDGRLSNKKIIEISLAPDDKAFIEKLYPGYKLAECKPFYNEFNAAYYICVKMYIDKNYKKERWKNNVT